MYKVVTEILVPNGHTSFHFYGQVNGETGSIYHESSSYQTQISLHGGPASGEYTVFEEFVFQNRGNSSNQFHFAPSYGFPVGYSSQIGASSTSVVGPSGVGSYINLNGLTPSTYIEEFTFTPLHNTSVAYAIYGSVTVFGLL
jgi:hypothetical protein